ncbi:MAG: LuxR family transcriptional regulator [Gammaproteobacteria bacterium]|nr:LuxR family transcriptional regulator [Gammaproteobacteria bacterium]
MRELLFSATSAEEEPGSYSSLLHFEPILNASSLTELAREVRQAIRHLGFQHYLYGARVQNQGGETLQYIFSGYPEEWMQAYQAARHIEIDPIVEHCFLRNSATPVMWDNRLFNTPERRMFWEEAQGFGVASGLSVPVRASRGEVALFSAANPERGRDAVEHQAQMAGMMYVLSGYLHEAIRQLVYAPHLIPVAPARLTAREIECLAWWANGKTAWEIAQLLNLSERTVRFHFDNIKIKLGVQKKSHAIARAVKLQLVQP